MFVFVSSPVVAKPTERGSSQIQDTKLVRVKPFLNSFDLLVS